MRFPEFLTQAIMWLSQCLTGRLRVWIKPITETPVLGAVTDITRSRRELLLENALLRQQLLVVNRQVKRPKLRERDRLVIVGLASRLATWKNALLIVKPETVLRWHRELFRGYGGGSLSGSRRSDVPGCPRSTLRSSGGWRKRT